MGLYVESLFDALPPEKKTFPNIPTPPPLLPSEPKPITLCNHQDLSFLRNALGNKLPEYEPTLQELEKALDARNYDQAMNLVDLLEELVDLELR